MGQKIRISGPAFVWLALLTLVLPLRWIAAAIFAAAFHECCHVLAIRICGGRIDGLRITERGASMKTVMLSKPQELLCALAGPLGSILLILTAEFTPRLAVCGMFHGLYNLMPLYPMDGGRVLRCAAELAFGEEMSERVCFWITRIFCVVLLTGGLYAFFVLRVGLFPLLLAGFVICRANIRKMPCKEKDLAVQYKGYPMEAYCYDR